MDARQHRIIHDRGSVTTLVAVLLVVVVGAQALLVDVLRLHGERWSLQTAVDAAATAAASYLPGDDDVSLGSAVAAALDYSAQNGVSLDDVSLEFTTDSAANDRVMVTASRRVDLSLGSIFGIRSTSVSAKATAQIGTLAAMAGVLPWGVLPSSADLEFGELSCLKLGANDEICPKLRGSFTALDIDAVGSDSAAVYRDRIVTGSTTQITLGATRSQLTGNMVGPTQQGLGCSGNNGRISGNNTTFEEIVVSIGDGHQVLDWTNSRIAVLPIVQPGAPGTVTVVGFAAFFIEGCGGGGSGSVTGRFIRTVVPGGGWERLQADFGARSVRLTE